MQKRKATRTCADWQPRDNDELHRAVHRSEELRLARERRAPAPRLFDRRGDDDMARHLLAEAPSRIPRWSLDKTAPRLNAWASTTAAAWKIDLGL